MCTEVNCFNAVNVSTAKERFSPPRRATAALALFFLVIAAAVAPANTQPLSFDNAQWIWFTENPDLPMGSIPEGSIYLRAEVTLPEKPLIKSAEVALTCDNLFSLTVNGKPAGESDSPDAWNQPRRYNVTNLLAPGRNLLAIEAVNTAPGPAGLIVTFIAQLDDGREITLVSNGSWKANDTADLNWREPGFDDKTWRQARVLGPFSMDPWGKPAIPPAASAPQSARQAAGQFPEAEPGFRWPEAIAFIGDDCSLYRPRGGTGSAYDSLSVTVFNPRDSRAFPEHDLPSPMKVGHRLYTIKPAKPGVKPQVLLDAGKGAIGSPSVAYDGKSIYVSMVPENEFFYHIYKVPVDGGKPQRLTDGPFHDIDPCELPDGRIAFTSTRIGTFEEYHNTPSRALFTMKAGGTDIRLLTSTFIFDNEPEVLADGRILFIRSDNFFGRGKVETLLHAINPDGTAGYTEFGLDIGPDYGGRLRAFNCGSPAPMTDGRVAFVTGSDVVVGRCGSPSAHWMHIRIPAGDVAAMPDGRLLCTMARPVSAITLAARRQRMPEVTYGKIGIVDPVTDSGRMVLIHDSPDQPLHSPVYLGARHKPPVLAAMTDSRTPDNIEATGILYCQNVRLTKNTTAGWSNVRAIRVLAGKGLTTRSSHSYIVHAGADVTELGTVPLAPDGSFAVEVPADTAIAFQAVDAEGRSELNEMSWIYVRPGEKRGCVGCHHTRQVTPPPQPAYINAAQTAPLKLTGKGQPHRFRGNNAAVTGLMELQFDRYREVAGINRHSDTTSPLASGTQEVASLISALKSHDTAIKISAAQRLAVFRDRRAAPSLAECLKHESRELRVTAAMAIAACGTRGSIPPLLGALDDDDPVVRQAAAVALENLTGHSDPAFNAYSPNRQARNWREWFKTTGWEEIEKSQVDLLSSADRDIVRRAAVALGHTGETPAARAALRNYLARERNNNPLPMWRRNHQGDSARFNSRDAVNPRTIQEVTRALGYMQDREAVPLLAETLNQNANPGNGNLFLAEAAAEALGRIGTPDAEAALIGAFSALRDYPEYTRWYGDHDALIACNASPVHYLITEALDSLGSKAAKGIVPQLIRSVPTDFDRALLLNSDDCETVTGRVISRNDPDGTVLETCFSILGEAQARPVKAIADSIAHVHGAWGGTPTPEIRAAQILSMVCRDRKHEPRVRAAFERYLTKPTTITRVFNTGIPVVNALPAKHWCCFFLARTLGNLADPQSADTLIATLANSPSESAAGNPDPLGPGVIFLQNDLTPCWRAAVAWALGRIGSRHAAPVLLKVVADLGNATDTRHAAAEALERIADPGSVASIRTLAPGYPEISTRKVLLRASAISKVAR